MYGGMLDGGFADPKRAVEEIVKRCATSDNKANTTATGTGMMPGKVTILTGEGGVTFPEVLPVVTAEWPEPIKAEWNTFQSYSKVGLFATLSRAFITADNKLLIWNFFSGREFLCYSDISELLIAVGEPVAPRKGVFQNHISRIIPIATKGTVHFVGVSLIGADPKSAEMRLLNVGYATTSPCVVAKFVVDQVTGRVFAAGLDGNLYEVDYSQEGTAYQPKMRLVNHSIAFGRYPILNTVGALWKNLKQTWSKQQPPLRDIALIRISPDTAYVFTLDTLSSIATWKLVKDGGLEYLATVSHNAETIERTLHSNTPSQVLPLVSIFPARTERGLNVMAVAVNGDLYRYTFHSGGYKTSLEVRERTASPFAGTGQSREVREALYSRGVFLCAHSNLADAAEADALTISSPPSTVLPQFQHIRDVTSTYEKDITGIQRVDSIGDLTNSSDDLTSPIVSQVSSPPTMFVLAHRHGVTLLAKMRPVDTLHMILMNGDPQRREDLYKRYAGAHSPVDLCCMLLQVASGDTNVTQLVDGPSSLQKRAVRPTVDTIHRLGMSLSQPVSNDVQRIAKELIKQYAMPSWSEVARGGNPDERFVQITMSTFAIAVNTLTGRILNGLWDQMIFSCSQRMLRVCEILLAELKSQVDSLKGEIWPDTISGHASSLAACTFWDGSGKVALRMPGGPTPAAAFGGGHHGVSPQDIRSLHSMYIAASAQLIDRAQQAIRFLRHLEGFTWTNQSDNKRFNQIVCSENDAKELTKSVANTIFNSTESARKRDMLRVFAKMQKECTCMFSNVDVTEFKALSELDRVAAVLPGNIKMWAPERVREFENSIVAEAAALWANGSLKKICEHLRQMQKEDSAVRLLLHAAAQIDPSQGSWDVYLAQRGLAPAGYLQSQNDLYNCKSTILTLVTETLELAWCQNQAAAEQLIGTPNMRGLVWSVEPSDAMAHCTLFDWLLWPREDAHIQKQLEDTVLVCQSPFLERYLEANAQLGGSFGKHYAKYLRTIKRNHQGAIYVVARMAQGPLLHLPESERLGFREDCWREAMDCATEGHLPTEQAEIEKKLKVAAAQRELAEVIQRQIAFDEAESAVGGGARREGNWRQVLSFVCASQIEGGELFRIAADFIPFGGAEVQLAVAAAFQSVHPQELMLIADQCFEHQGKEPPRVAESILKKFSRMPNFPLTIVIRHLEAHSYRQTRGVQESTATVDLLCDCGVELHAVFCSYLDILERRDQAPLRHNPLEGVPESFLCFSLALTVKRLVAAPMGRSAGGQVGGPLVVQARDLLQVVRRRSAPNDMSGQRRVMDAAERILDQCQAGLRHESSFSRAGAQF